MGAKKQLYRGDVEHNFFKMRIQHIHNKHIQNIYIYINTALLCCIHTRYKCRYFCFLFVILFGKNRSNRIESNRSIDEKLECFLPFFRTIFCLFVCRIVSIVVICKKICFFVVLSSHNTLRKITLIFADTFQTILSTSFSPFSPHSVDDPIPQTSSALYCVGV
jgi:hypothetical protein